MYIIINSKKVKSLELPDEIKDEDYLFRPFRNVSIIRTTEYNLNIIKLTGYEITTKDTLEDVIAHIYDTYIYEGILGNGQQGMEFYRNKGLVALISQSSYYSSKFLLRTRGLGYSHELEKAVLRSPTETLNHAIEMSINLPKFKNVLRNDPTLLARYNKHFSNKKAP